MNAALMHAATNLLQDPEKPEKQYSTRCNGNAGHTPAIVKTTDETPATANSTQSTPAVETRAWHHTAMSAATFTLSALLAYIATGAICKRIRGRN